MRAMGKFGRHGLMAIRMGNPRFHHATCTLQTIQLLGFAEGETKPHIFRTDLDCPWGKF